MIDSEVLQKAKYFRDSPFGVGWLPDLIDLAEKWQAIAIEERANRLLHPELGEDEYRIFAGMEMFTASEKAGYRHEAEKQLQAESSSWKKIGTNEIAAIEFIIAHSEHDDEIDGLTESKRILDRLISEEDDKI